MVKGREQPMGNRLQGKVAIVTGAAAGFGEAMARRFVQEGAKVVLADLDGEIANQIASDLGDSAIACKVDVSVEVDIKKAIDLADQKFGKLNILVNNAGFSHRNCPMESVDEETFDRIFGVNAKAIYFAVRHALPILKKEGGGSIINTASTAGLRPRPGLTWYNASKGWVITATKSLAVELANQNIRVNALCPVAGETGMLPLFLGEDTPERREQFRSTVPLGRLSQPEDISNAALWLASDEAEFITGVALEVDGGRCI